MNSARESTPSPQPTDWDSPDPSIRIIWEVPPKSEFRKLLASESLVSEEAREIARELSRDLPRSSSS